MWDALLSVDACVGCVRSGRPPFSFPLSLGSVCSPLSLLFLVSFSLLLFAVGNGLHPLVRFAIFFSSPSCPVCIRSSGSVLAASCTFSSGPRPDADLLKAPVGGLFCDLRRFVGFL